MSNKIWIDEIPLKHSMATHDLEIWVKLLCAIEANETKCEYNSNVILHIS